MFPVRDRYNMRKENVQWNLKEVKQKLIYGLHLQEKVRHALVDAVRVHEVVRAAFHHGRGVIPGVVLRGIAVVARVVNDNVLDGPCVPCRAIIPCVGAQLLNFHPCPPY